MNRLLALIIATASLSTASAQTFASLQFGGAEFDLSGTGHAFVGDVRVTHLLNRYVAVEGGLGLSPVPEQFRDVTYLLPSLELQLGATLRESARPYIGVGVGAFAPVIIDRFSNRVRYESNTEAAGIASVGIDVGLTDQVILRGAGRLRVTFGDGPDLFVGSFAELVGGLGVRL